MELNNLLKRRILFLLDAAKNEDKRDQAVTYTMRVLSNHAAVGKDAGSSEIKKLNRRITMNAKQLLLETDINNFCKNTINEHPKPMQQTWNWLRENAHSLSCLDVWSEFKDNQMITVTKTEDQMIRRSGQNSSGDIYSRYYALSITPILLDCPPIDFIKS